MTPQQFKQALATLGWRPERAAVELRLSLRTVARYAAGTGVRPIPYPVAHFLRDAVTKAHQQQNKINKLQIVQYCTQTT